jgi:hypothetical protein
MKITVMEATLGTLSTNSTLASLILRSSDIGSMRNARPAPTKYVNPIEMEIPIATRRCSGVTSRLQTQFGRIDDIENWWQVCAPVTVPLAVLSSHD